MYVGIIAASMVALPKFLKSPLFRSSTYAELWQRFTPKSLARVSEASPAVASHPGSRKPAPESGSPANRTLLNSQGHSSNESSQASRSRPLRTFFNPNSTLDRSYTEEDPVPALPTSRTFFNANTTTHDSYSYDEPV